MTSISLDKNQMAEKVRKGVEGKASDMMGKLKKVPRNKVTEFKATASNVSSASIDSIDGAIECMNNMKEDMKASVSEGVSVNPGAAKVSQCVSSDLSGMNVSSDGKIKPPDCKFSNLSNNIQDKALDNFSSCMSSALSNLMNIASKIEQSVELPDIDKVLESESCISASVSPSGIDVELENSLNSAGMTLDGEMDYSGTGLDSKSVDKLKQLNNTNKQAQKEIRDSLSIPNGPEPEF